MNNIFFGRVLNLRTKSLCVESYDSSGDLPVNKTRKVQVGMVKGRVMDLRWTETVTREVGEEMRVRSVATPTQIATSVVTAPAVATPLKPRDSGNESRNISPVLRLVLGPPPPIDDEEIMVPVTEGMHGGDIYEEVMEVVVPKLVPITPVMRFVRRDVVQEYEDDQSISEYASLSDVEY